MLYLPTPLIIMQKDEAYQKTFELLKTQQLYQACRIVAEYELSRPRPRGLFDDPWAYWRSYPDKDSLFILQVIIDHAPELPHSDCIHEMGCRCDYLPVF